MAKKRIIGTSPYSLRSDAQSSYRDQLSDELQDKLQKLTTPLLENDSYVGET